MSPHRACVTLADGVSLLEDGRRLRLIDARLGPRGVEGNQNKSSSEG
jgi:hypothetical protein